MIYPLISHFYPSKTINRFSSFKPTSWLFVSCMPLKVFALYFLSIATCAAEIAQTRIDFNQLGMFAQYSAAIYESESAIQNLAEKNARQILHYATIPDLEVTYFVSVSPAEKNTLITVRGTANVENALLDIALQLKKDDRTGIQLHHGFAVIADQIMADILPKLDKQYTITTTGHSLGGAVALILAIYLDHEKFQIDQIVTFGQPKITNIIGALQFNHLNCIRVVTQHDIVPLVPPVDLVDINNIDIYWHLGKEVILLENNDFTIATGLDSALRATNVFDKKFNKTSVLEHQVSYYIKQISQKTAQAIEKPYKNRFNIFNVFN